MQLGTQLLIAALGGALTAGPVLAQTTGIGATGTGTSGSTSLPPSTRQSTPSTPNTGIGGSVTGGIPGTLGGTPYSIGGSVTGGIPGTLGGVPAGGGSSQSNTPIGGAGISTTPTTPSTIGGSSTGALGGSSSGALGGSGSGVLGTGTAGDSTGTLR